MTDPAPCGTYAGWNAHRHKNTPVCPPCRAAATAYAKDRRRRAGHHTATHFPIETRHDITTLPGLGSVIARGLRETA